jgi:hypothetical protein
MIERTTVRLPKELLDRARCKAAADGVTSTALIGDGLRKVVSEQPAKTSAKHTLPRISNATGGLLPGIDLANSAAIQEIEDVGYMGRVGRFRRDPNP